jgi:membrane-associated phospholipid phosphatase
MARRAFHFTLFCLALISALSFSGQSWAADSRPYELKQNPTLDPVLTITGATLWLAAEMFKIRLAPQTCRWCDRDEQGRDSLNAFDKTARNALRWSNPRVPYVMSDVMAYGVAPLAAFGLDAVSASNADALDAFGADAAIITQATVLAADVNQLVKFLAGRERPFVHALRAGQKPRTWQPSDNNTSFFSGHTSLVFALAASSGTVCMLRAYGRCPLIWGTGLSIAATVGYLRIAADRHYLSDVLVGAVVASTMGVLIPLALHGRTSERVAPDEQKLTSGLRLGFNTAW